jgi:YHS domain-containing protein
MIENARAEATDPACGMTVDPGSPTAAGRTAEHEGQTYYFCSKGCILEFRDDAERYLDPSYTPTM